MSTYIPVSFLFSFQKGFGLGLKIGLGLGWALGLGLGLGFGIGNLMWRCRHSWMCARKTPVQKKTQEKHRNLQNKNIETVGEKLQYYIRRGFEDCDG